MMRSEFEQLTGREVSIEDYAVIEAAYSACENLFPDKQSIADFYRFHGYSVDIFDKLLLDLGNSQMHYLIQDMRVMYDTLCNIKAYVDGIDQDIRKVNLGMNDVTCKNLSFAGAGKFSERSEKSE